MATSNVFTYSDTTDTIIRDALIEIGRISERDQGIDSALKDLAKRKLNRIVKEWQGEGIKLWKRKIATLFSALNEESYLLGPTGTHATETYVSTTLSGAEASGQTALSVTSSTGMTAGDYVGIELDNGTRQWTTISTVNSSILITVGTALTSAAASGNSVVSYTTKIQKPVKIISPSMWTRLDYTTPTESSMKEVQYDVYNKIPDKTAPGNSYQFVYNKNLTNGNLIVYPVPDSVEYIFKLMYLEPLQIFGTSATTGDFPEEMSKALVLNLAYEMGPPSGSFAKLPELEKAAARSKAIAAAFDSEEASFCISPSGGE